MTPMIIYYLKLCLLIATTDVICSDVSTYIPKVAASIQGNVTLSTFVLEQPQCIFTDQYPTEDVWLVVALNSVEPLLTDKDLSTPVSYSSFPTNKFYHTLNVHGFDYPCFNSSVNTLALLQVGSEVNCSNSFCNGPLTSPGPYRVRFVVLNNGVIVAKSNRSDLITLPQAKNASMIDPWPTSRSGGMIVITVILSILLAILLSCLIFALCFGSKNICWHAGLRSGTVLETGTAGSYKSTVAYEAHTNWNNSIQEKNRRHIFSHEQKGSKKSAEAGSYDYVI
ncbi:hypothetical protein GDO86_003796 [Hymenochirus boettgeri]|uniref:Uroplakin 3b n=1 Tax=Hymenochirus boettgeri TaxID=247094 RepID=A0A8T2K7D9_9PIPI|nr:hypothetical protein GDO86_003796 [Hymenochirus boettgeri]